MAVTILSQEGDSSGGEQAHGSSKTKIIFVTLLFLLSLASFVMQTEFTSQAYKIGFKEPIVLLYLTHGSWWILWPTQILVVSFWRSVKESRTHKGQKGSVAPLEAEARLLSSSEATGDETVTVKQFSIARHFKKGIVKQVHTVYHTAILIYEANVNNDTSTHTCNDLIAKNPRISNTSSISECFKTFVATPAFKYVFTKSFIIAVVLTIAGLTWYGAMALTTPSDVTAIYNCSAFTAYAFAIPILKEKFSWLKASSVIAAISGVFIVAYSEGRDVADSKTPADENEYPYRFWGNLIILAGAILYGYYEVLYKKYVCLPPHLDKLITPRRQLTFANFIMALFGLVTNIVLGTAILFSQLVGIHKFHIFDYGDRTLIIWFFVVGSGIANLLFSALFLSLMALTSPVLSSVSSLLTIFLIGVIEWVIFGNSLNALQLLGNCFVIIGFVILTAASWKEISEGHDHDEIENASTYSFPASNYA